MKSTDYSPDLGINSSGSGTLDDPSDYFDKPVVSQDEIEREMSEDNELAERLGVSKGSEDVYVSALPDICQEELSGIFDKESIRSQREIEEEMDADIGYGDSLVLKGKGAVEVFGDETPTNAIPCLPQKEAHKKPVGIWTPFSLAQSLLQKCHFLIVDKAVYCFIGIVYVLLDDTELDRLIYKHQRDAIQMEGRPGVIAEIRKFIKLESAIDSIEVDSEHIVLLNGRYNLSENRFEDNDHRIFATSYLNIEYDESNRYCPAFGSYLDTVTGGNDKMKHLILEVMGYLLSCNNSAKKFFVLFGPGNTGKSLFLSLMREFFPMQFVSTIELQDLGGRFSSGNLVDTRLNVGGDLPNKVLSADVIKTVKGLTGGDVMTAERKFQQPFSYKPTTKLLFATNHKITLAYKDEQFIERLVLLPFLNPVPPERQDRELLNKMKCERSAIFNKALKAFKRLSRNNFVFTEVDDSSKFVNIPSGGRENRSLLAEAIMKFIDERCDIAQSKDRFTTISDLFTAFSDYYMERYNLNVEMDEFSKGFKAIALSMELEYKQKNRGRGYRGIQILEE